MAPSDISVVFQIKKWTMTLLGLNNVHFFNLLPAMLDHCAPLTVPFSLTPRDDPQRALEVDIDSCASAYVLARSLNTYGIKRVIFYLDVIVFI